MTRMPATSESTKPSRSLSNGLDASCGASLRDDKARAEMNPPTPEAALEMAGREGTRSILDFTRITAEPEPGGAAALSPGELLAYFGTERPTRETIRQCGEFWESIEPGQARLLILFEGTEPEEICFAGISRD